MDFGVNMVVIFNFFKKYSIKIILAFTFCLPLFISLNEGLYRPFFFLADVDFPLIGESLAYNSNLSQKFFDHPSFCMYIIFGWYLRFLHFFDSSVIDNFSSLYKITNTIQTFEKLVFHARIFGLILCEINIILFYFLLKKITNNAYIAAISTLFFVCTEGVLVNSIFLRMEILSFILLNCSIYFFHNFLIETNRNEISLFIQIFLVGFFVYLASITKILCIFILVFILPIFSFFYLKKLNLKAIKVDISWPFLFLNFPIVTTFLLLTYRVISENNIFSYLILLLLYLIFLVTFYFKSRQFRFILVMSLALISGISVASSVNYLRFNIENHNAVMNFYERAKTGSRYRDYSIDQIGLAKIGIEKSKLFFTSKLDFDYLKKEPFLIIFVFLIFSGFTSLFSNFVLGSELLAWLIAYSCIEAIFGLRYVDVKNTDTVIYYKIYTYSLIIIALSKYYSSRIKNLFWGIKSNILYFCLIIIISTASFISSNKKIHSNSVYGLDLRQDEKNACMITQIYSDHLYHYFLRNGKTCINEIKNSKS